MDEPYHYSDIFDVHDNTNVTTARSLNFKGLKKIRLRCLHVSGYPQDVKLNILITLESVYCIKYVCICAYVCSSNYY